MSVITDGIGNKIELTSFNRIVSLVPSQTEYLFDLGLDERVVGITKFCVHPHSWWKDKTRVGGTKNLNLEKIRSLNPDLIIANKEENDASQVKSLAKEFPVYTSVVSNLEEAIVMMKDIGILCSAKAVADGIIAKIQSSFQVFKPELSGTCLYLIWNNPWMSVGSDTFIHDMLQRIGLDNFCEHQTRYPEVNLEELENLPDYIFLSSEPYPFKEKDLASLSSQFPKSKVILVDGEYFSWYGSRLVGAVDYFKTILKS